MKTIPVYLKVFGRTPTRGYIARCFLASTVQHRSHSESAQHIEHEYSHARKVLEKDGSVYYDHKETTQLQDILLALGSSFVSMVDPTRTDMVAALTETTASRALCRKLYQKMASDPVGNLILKEKPMINSKTVDLDQLLSLPDRSFGKEYALFMSNLGLTADTRSPVSFIKDPELAYVVYRYRTIHDFTHVLLGMPSISVAAEVAVKWFEVVQTGLPMTFFASTFGLFSNGITSSERRVLVKDLVPWALLCGRNAKFLLNIYFEKELERNIDEFRASIGVIPAPVVL